MSAMSKLIALFQFLLALAGFSSGGTTWTSQVHDNGQVLSSRGAGITARPLTPATERPATA